MVKLANKLGVTGACVGAVLALTNLLAAVYNGTVPLLFQIGAGATFMALIAIWLQARLFALGLRKFKRDVKSYIKEEIAKTAGDIYRAGMLAQTTATHTPHHTEGQDADSGQLLVLPQVSNH